MRSSESQREDRSRPLTAPVELRIHGVGGATPEILLGHPHTVQVAGDDTAGFYRPALSQEGKSPEGLEAYSWGGITSRSGSRALWLLVLPFAFTNAAGFMLDRGSGRRLRFGRAVLRLLGLAVTILFVLWAGGLALDLIAYQCGGDPSCRSRHWWLTFFENPYLADNPTRRLAVGMLVPAALILALRRATTFTRTRYEEAFAMEPVRADEVGTDEPNPASTDPAGMAGLGHRVFWHSSKFSDLLGAAHIGAAAAALAGATAYANWRLLRDSAPDDTINLIEIVAAILIGLVAALVTITGGKGPARVLPALGWTLVGVVAATGLFGAAPIARPTDDLPGYSRAALITGLAALLLAVLLMAALLGRRMMPPVATTSVGIFAMGTFLAGSHVRLADWLGNRDGSDNQPTIAYSEAYDWFSVAALAVMVAVVIAGVAALLWLHRQSHNEEVLAKLNTSYGGKPIDGERRTWLSRIARSEALSRLVNRADVALAALMSTILLGAIAFYWIRTFGSGSPLGSIGSVPAGLRPVVPVATWIGSILPLIGLGVMYQSFRNPGTRRRVAVLWDIVTFWPRWYHPLAPPPYSARAVPELGVRLDRLTSEGATVTLSAHSQGSVIAASSIARLPDEICRRVLLLTHGSPLGRLYGKFFPAYFGPEDVKTVHDRVGGRWINLYRITDPIGGSVGLDSVDRRCLDPETDDRQPGDPLPRVRGHAFYAGSAAYTRAIADLGAVGTNQGDRT